MKAFLMFKDRDFDVDRKPPPNAAALTQDLELDTLFDAMAGGDAFVREIAVKAVFNSLTSVEEILYRQNALADCLANPAAIREIYRVAVESIEKEKKQWRGFYSDYPSGRLSSSVEALQMFVGQLRQLRAVADGEASKFKSEAFTTFFAMLQRELGDDFFATVNQHLAELRFRHGVLLSARLGPGNKGTAYVLRKPNEASRSWFARIFGDGTPGFTYHLAPRDEAGARALGDLRDTGIRLVADALSQSTDHILSFFRALRAEIAFYVAGLNLHGQLSEKSAAVAFPTPVPLRERTFSCRNLYDVCLSLSLGRKIVGNDVDAEGALLVIITGANQGGKSTFLRSVGQAQLMTQCGMFVAAEALRVNVCDGLFTHYKREEDASMSSGKFDEELARMNGIADLLTPNSMVLFNESFASTNEREGSEIARQIVRALVEGRVKVFFVTHMYDLADSFYALGEPNNVFLRAERQEGGERTFRLIVGEPLETSYGKDLYDAIFLSAPQGATSYARL